MANEENRKLTDQYLLRLPEGLRGKIKHQANANGRSMNSEILTLLLEQYGWEREERYNWFDLYHLAAEQPIYRFSLLGSQIRLWLEDPEIYGGEKFIADMFSRAKLLQEFEAELGRQGTLAEISDLLVEAFPDDEIEIRSQVGPHRPTYRSEKHDREYCEQFASFPDLINDRCRNLNLTFQELSYALDMPEALLNRYLSGVALSKPAILARLARALDFSEVAVLEHFASNSIKEDYEETVALAISLDRPVEPGIDDWADRIAEHNRIAMDAYWENSKEKEIKRTRPQSTGIRAIDVNIDNNLEEDLDQDYLPENDGPQMR